MSPWILPAPPPMLPVLPSAAWTVAAQAAFPVRLSDDFVAMFEPWIKNSPDLGDIIRTFGEMFDPYQIFVSDQGDGTLGYSAMLDPDLCPVEALPWLAQWVGERLPIGLTDAAVRRYIKTTPNQYRGTIRGVARAAMQSLSGSKTVILHPRFQLDGTAAPDFLTMYTLNSETPNPDRCISDTLAGMPADIQLNYAHPTAATWAQVATLGMWSDVAAEGTWGDVANTSARTGNGWYVFDSTLLDVEFSFVFAEPGSQVPTPVGPPGITDGPVVPTPGTPPVVT